MRKAASHFTDDMYESFKGLFSTFYAHPRIIQLIWSDARYQAQCETRRRLKSFSQDVHDKLDRELWKYSPFFKKAFCFTVSEAYKQKLCKQVLWIESFLSFKWQKALKFSKLLKSLVFSHRKSVKANVSRSKTSLVEITNGEHQIESNRESFHFHNDFRCQQILPISWMHYIVFLSSGGTKSRSRTETKNQFWFISIELCR